MAIDDVALATSLYRAVKQLLDLDSYLLEEDVNERSITHRLAMYLQTVIHDLNVDVEYNRNLGEIKQITGVNKKTTTLDDSDACSVYPDIIVHKRNSAENYLVIETKKKGKDESLDVLKLVSYTDNKQRKPEVKPLRYQLGVHIVFPVGPDQVSYEPTYKWYKDGIETNDPLKRKPVIPQHVEPGL